MDSDEMYCFVEQFHENASDQAESIAKLMDSVPQLLAKYPSEVAVTEAICKAIIKCACTQRNDALDSDGSLEVTTSLVGALAEVHWEAQSIPFVRLACEAVTRLLVLFHQTRKFRNILELVAWFLKFLFSKLESSPKSLIALGGSFPNDLPESVYLMLVEHGIHDKVLNLVAMYSDMSEANLSNLLNVLQRFAMAAPSCAYTYAADSTSFLLLFAAQQFSSSDIVQDSLWKLLIIVMSIDQEYTIEVNPDVLIPAILPTMSETTCNHTPLVNFLIEYSSIPNREPLLVISCLTEYPELLQVLLQLLDTTRELESQKQREEVAAVSNLLELFFWKFNDYPTAKFVIQYRILDFLKQAAIKWPDLSCLSYCTAVRQFLNLLPTSLDSLEFTEHVPFVQKDSFFGENQLLDPFSDLLCRSHETFFSEEIRSSIYDAVSFLLKSTPSNKRSEWLTDDFLLSFISSLPQDVMLFRNKIHVFMSIGHFILHTLKNDRMQVIRDQEWHHVAIHCLNLADYHEARSACLGFASCILHGYGQSLNDISPFYDSPFPHLIVDFAKQFGLGIDSEAGKTFNFLILALTADKQASTVHCKNGLLNDLYPLIQDQYDPCVIQPAIHAIGNIALSSHHVQKEILDKGFHITLIDYLGSNMSTTEPSILSACCRVLHILAFDEWAKHKLAEEGLVNILLKMLEMRRDNTEVCWRTLGLLSSFGFTSLSNLEYIFSEKMVRSVMNLLRTTEQKYCNALVFLASTDNDKSPYHIKVTQMFQQMLHESEDVDASCDLLQKWESFSSEKGVKGHLFTIPLNSGPLRPEEEQLVASCMVQSLTWPETPSSPVIPKEWKDDATVATITLHESLHLPQFPEAPKLTDDAVSQIFQLGLNTFSLFRIQTFRGSCSYGHYSFQNRLGEITLSPLSLTPNQYQELITRGWYRRGGVTLYRHSYDPDVEHNDWETRVLISEFDHRKHKSYKKVLRRMPEDRLTIETVPTQFISEACDLYGHYHIGKHGRMCMTPEPAYCNHVVNSPVRNQSVDGFQYGSFHQLYRLDGKLVAVGVIDIVPNGVVSVYMWYDTSKEIAKYSFGVYSSLKEIEFARELSKCNPSIKYYYLQGWNESNLKYSYKARFEPEEFYSPCTVLGWVSGLEGVKKEQESFKERYLLKTTEASESSSHLNHDTTGVPGDALLLDRIRYEIDTGLEKPDVMKIVVCLNHQIYMYLGHMLDAYATSAYQRNIIVEEFEELVLAVGPKLSENMILDLVACPDTGKLEGYPDETFIV